MRRGRKGVSIGSCVNIYYIQCIYKELKFGLLTATAVNAIKVLDIRKTII